MPRQITKSTIVVVTLAALLAAAQVPASAATHVVPGKGPASRISRPTAPPGALRPLTSTAAPRLAQANSTADPLTPPAVVRGQDDAVWVRRGFSWQSLGGRVVAAPTARVVPAAAGGQAENLYIATGVDNGLWIRNDATAWHPLAPFPVSCLDGPAAVVSGTPGAYSVSVACKGKDAALWVMSGPVTPGALPSIKSKISLGGPLRSQPAALAWQGVPTYFEVGTDSHVWYRTVSTCWQVLPTLQCYGHPAAGVSGSGMGVVTCWGMDNALWFVRNTGGGWSNAMSAGGIVTEDLQVRGMATDVVADVAGGDSHDWETSITPSGVAPWMALGATVHTISVPDYTLPFVPVYWQTYPLDCEAAAQQMALTGLGHPYSQGTLLSAQSADYRAGYWSNGTLRWGNPYANFVGNPSGSEGNYTGYGVYYPVIAAIARSHGAPNSYGAEGLSSVQVYNALAAAHPVQVWIEYNWVRPTMGSWLTFDGSRWIRYSTWEHSVTLVGVSANAVLVNDPGHGNQYWVSRSQFETSWGDFDNMAVVYQ